MTADQCIETLRAHRSDAAVAQYKSYYQNTPDGRTITDEFLGVPMGAVFALSKQFVAMPADQIAIMLQSPMHEVKACALSVMDKQAALKKTTPEQLETLYDLYMDHIDGINDWRLVDVSCRYTVGRYLFDKPRDVLYKLAVSPDMWQRRIAIISTWYFISKGDTTDTFGVAEKLLQDKQELVQKAVGWMLREAGNKNPDELAKFLSTHAAKMPRLTLRSATERLPKAQREQYLKQGAA